MPPNNDDDESVTTFVDYIEPPSPTPTPPAKYKLWLMILVLVFFAEWFATEANFTVALQMSGWLSPTAALFLTLATIVFVLVFATLDLAVAVFTIKIRGRPYGIGPWLKAGRSVWIHQKQNCIAEFLAIIVKILEDGFSMFDAQLGYTTIPKKNEDIDNEELFTCPSEECHVVLKIDHRINPAKMEEYHEWTRKIDRATSRHARGLVDVRKSEFTHEADIYDEGLGKSISRQLHMIYMTFENVDYLNEWMTSRQRQKLIGELQPLLVQPDIVQIQNDRSLPDAFTDLLVKQGESVPSLTPKKWKVWWLTLLGLFFVQLWTRDVMPYYYSRWGLDGAHERARGFVAVLISTFLNSYVMTPLLLFLFSPWIKRREGENDPRQPWKTLNDGFESLWLKATLTIALYGGFVVAWVVGGYT
ncbi:hypothetical protein ACHAXR_009315 [Thalassiosira sp. AJA248-18]